MKPIAITEFADRLNEIVPVMMKEFGRRTVKELYKQEITLPQFFILEYLHKEGELKMTDLAHFMNVTTAAMTGIVDRLVREKYLERTFEPQDRRIIKVKLTAKGEELVKKVSQQRRQMVIRTFGKISEKDRGDYLRILSRIRDVLTIEKETNA
jgi:DNA-binding MarR family transcriptional regulator